MHHNNTKAMRNGGGSLREWNFVYLMEKQMEMTECLVVKKNWRTFEISGYKEHELWA